MEQFKKNAVESPELQDIFHQIDALKKETDTQANQKKEQWKTDYAALKEQQKIALEGIKKAEAAEKKNTEKIGETGETITHATEVVEKAKVYKQYVKDMTAAQSVETPANQPQEDPLIGLYSTVSSIIRERRTGKI